MKLFGLCGLGRPRGCQAGSVQTKEFVPDPIAMISIRTIPVLVVVVALLGGCRQKQGAYVNRRLLSGPRRISSLFRVPTAGDRIRAGDVQLGKLAC